LKLSSEYEIALSKREIDYDEYVKSFSLYVKDMQKYHVDLAKYDAQMKEYQKKYPDIFPTKKPIMPTMPEKPEITEPELPK
jgi:hypothetical protein